MLMFHSLAGIGGTYGLHGITRVSRACGNLCVAELTENRALTPVEINELEIAIAKIRASGPRT